MKKPYLSHLKSNTMSVNKAIILGRLGKDPELKQTEKTTIAAFSVATSEKFNGNEVTQWHNVKAFGELANNIAKYFKKGDRIYIEGKITYNTFEKDGKKQTYTDIIAQSFSFIDGKSKTDVQPEAAPETNNGGLPF